MRGTRFVLLVTVLLVVLSTVPVIAEAPVTLRINSVDATAYPAIRLNVAVWDEYGVPIRGLGLANFDVSEDRTLRSRPLKSVEPFVDPGSNISVVLAIDVSGSMKGAKLRDAQEASRRFLDGLAAQDSAALIAFAGTVDLNRVDPGREHPFTTDKKALFDIIAGLKAGGATPLYDTAYKAIRWAAVQPAGRRAVLLFTDGREEPAADGSGGSQVANEDTPIREANRVGVPVFTIGLGNDVDGAYLKRLALETGGIYQHATNSADLGRLFRNVSDLLKRQYRLTYASGLSSDGQTHRILVAVKVGQHTAFAETSLGPLPMLAQATRVPTNTPQPTVTASPVPTPEPTRSPTIEAGQAAAPKPPSATHSGLFGMSPLLLAAILAGIVFLLTLIWFIVGKRHSPPAPTYRCLRCGHVLESKDAPCPSCGFKGSYKE